MLNWLAKLNVHSFELHNDKEQNDNTEEKNKDKEKILLF
jgi:hypothetical protein